MTYQENEVLRRLPQHLKQFINDQIYDNYTPINQAVWRYVMRKNIAYLKKVAHGSYTDGLKKTGISTENIPSMYGMNRILKEIGWAAVAVDGFIPPTAFMEFQAYNVLVIAQDIRQMGHIEYTPAPDIIHEAAGHAPIIANPEYAEYLRRFGEIGSKAISSKKDYEMYEAIRHLSIIKEDPTTSEKDIKEGEERVIDLQNNMGEPSEMARIRNLHWWTVEYGLIGTLDEPKIYGAGLLSSIGESAWCMTDEVKKTPYTIAAAGVAFDITKPQPQLFVTPDFAHLSFVLEQFADQMALRKGGSKGIQQLIDSHELGTVEYNTGLQVSGEFTRMIKDENNQPIYIQTTGETVLSYRDKALVGHERHRHADGFGSPVGRLKNTNMAIENMSPYDLDAFKIREGERIQLAFEGGITVDGEVITGTRNRKGKILLISFRSCTVKYKEETLFKPEWGIYDMAVGSKIISCYAGPADPLAFDMTTHVPSEQTHHLALSEKEQNLNNLYAEIRAMRSETAHEAMVQKVFNTLAEEYREDWLLAIEIYEIVLAHNWDWKVEVLNHLQKVAKNNAKVAHLIADGIKLADNFSKESLEILP